MSASLAARVLAAICFLICLSGCPENPPVITNAQSAITLASPPGTESIVLGMGCFWGAERRMSQLPGVLDVESGYANGEVAADIPPEALSDMLIAVTSGLARFSTQVSTERHGAAAAALQRMFDGTLLVTPAQARGATAAL